MSEAIAAISTPLGMGGIATVRVSGDDAVAVADKIFKAKKNIKLADMSGYSAAFGAVCDSDGGKIDDAVALVFRAPKSFTGEDVVELSVHGGIYVVRRVLRAALDAGARLAEAGEFTRRAYENKKMNLMEAESIMSLISASGEQELKMARSLKDGAVSAEILKIKDTLLTVLAGVAVFSDYPDEDLPEAAPENIRADLEKINTALETLIKNYDLGKIIREGVDVAIIGAPNVGKSTLMNMLSRTERSIVTSIAGTTRDVIEETVSIGDVVLKLADTAGVRATADEVEAIGVSLATRRAENAQLLLAVFDGGRPLGEDDREILKLIENNNAIVIINKSDCEQKIEMAELSAYEPVLISAKEKRGEEELALRIKEKVGLCALSPDAAVLSNERQRSCAARAKTAIEEAIAADDMGYTLDAIGICADEALSALLELTGERITEAVANEVFSRFCVGK